jgi:adenylosuccinate synthase
MTDAQMISIVIAIIASLGALVYNNSRITDVGKRIDDLRDGFNKRLDDMNRHVDDKFEAANQRAESNFNLLMERLQRMEDNLTRQLADHETRIHKLEHP